MRRRIIEQFIRIHRPDNILLSIGGEIALYWGVKLHDLGILEKYSCNVLGRRLLSQKMIEIGEKVVPYGVVKSVEEALVSPERIGYPVLVRATFHESDHISSFVDNREELNSLVTSILPELLLGISKLLIDKSLKDWKKVEYEVVRDQYDNCIVICNIENIDPISLRTSNSIVVAPSQTLSSDEYNLLRSVSIKVVRHLNIIVNVGLSDSSAFASKTTGYPLAYITAKLVLELNLTELTNNITNATCACFEPSLDYVTIKVSKGNLRKSNRHSNEIESSKKSLDEVMSISRSFEEAFQQALRLVDEDITGFNPCPRAITDDELSTPTDERVFVLATALYQGYTIEHLFQLTKINRWFLYKFASIIKFIISCSNLSHIKKLEYILDAKQLGFCDKQIRTHFNITELELNSQYETRFIRPCIKQIDIISGEWSLEINYTYLTYHGQTHDIEQRNEDESGQKKLFF